MRIILLLAALLAAVPAWGQGHGSPPVIPACTFAVDGVKQISIAGSGSRTCGSMTAGSAASITDALSSAECSDVPAALGGGTSTLWLQWDPSLGGAGEWKCGPPGPPGETLPACGLDGIWTSDGTNPVCDLPTGQALDTMAAAAPCKSWETDANGVWGPHGDVVGCGSVDFSIHADTVFFWSFDTDCNPEKGTMAMTADGTATFVDDTPSDFPPGAPGGTKSLLSSDGVSAGGCQADGYNATFATALSGDNCDGSENNCDGNSWAILITMQREVVTSSNEFLMSNASSGHVDGVHIGYSFNADASTLRYSYNDDIQTTTTSYSTLDRTFMIELIHDHTVAGGNDNTWLYVDCVLEEAFELAANGDGYERSQNLLTFGANSTPPTSNEHRIADVVLWGEVPTQFTRDSYFLYGPYGDRTTGISCP